MLNYPPSGTSQTIGATEEIVKDGDTEVWEIYNTTGDVHPMHFHLVNVQLINRQLFDVANLAFSSSWHPGTSSRQRERTGLEGDGADVSRHGNPSHHEMGLAPIVDKNLKLVDRPNRVHNSGQSPSPSKL